MTVYTIVPQDDSNLDITVTDPAIEAELLDDSDLDVIIQEAENPVVLNITPAAVSITSAVTSVNGFVGDVTLTTTHINEGDNLYYTDGRVQTVIDFNSAGFATVAYVDQSEADAIASANTYTDGRETAITAAYQAYADQAEIDAIATSEAYTDARETAITTAYQAYADQAETDAISTSQAYTDTRETAITTAYENYTDTAVANLVDSAPPLLDTLNELAQALGDDENFSTTVTNSLALKANTADLGAVAFSNDYNDLDNLPVIPDLTGYATEAYVDQAELDAVATANSYTDTRETAIRADIPTDNSELTNGAGYITDYTVTQEDVTQHQAALEILESQITDLDHYTSTDFDADFALKGASDLSYDNSDSDLLSTNVKGALDELDSQKANISDLVGTLTLYSTDTASGVSTYFLAVDSIDDPDYDTTPVDIGIGPITGDDQLLGAVTSNAGIITGNPGYITLHTTGNIRQTSGGSGQNSGFYFTILHRDSGGTETIMGTSSTTANVTSSSYQEFFADCFLSNPITFTETDRIVIKYYSDNFTGSGSPEYDFQFGGTAPVRTVLPLPINVIAQNQTASEVPTDTTNFTNRLSGADTTVQHALETLDTAPVDGGTY